MCDVQAGVAAAPDSDAGNNADIQQALSPSGLSEEDQPRAGAGVAHLNAAPLPVSRQQACHQRAPLYAPIVCAHRLFFCALLESGILPMCIVNNIYTSIYILCRTSLKFLGA